MPAPDFGAGVASSAKMLGLELPRLESDIRYQASLGDKADADAVLSLTQANAVSSDVRVKNATANRIEQLTQPEKGEILAHTALMREQKGVSTATARQLAAEEALARARIPQVQADTRLTEAEIPGAEWESGPGKVFKAIGQTTSAIGDLVPAKSIGSAIFGGPNSGQRVKSSISNMKRRR